MISHLAYVNCDRCGDPAEAVVGNAKEAREVAQICNGFRRVNGEDICPNCRREQEGEQ